MWDTAGNEKFRVITQSFYRGASAIAFVFNIYDAQSFHELHGFFLEYERSRGGFGDAVSLPMIVIGTRVPQDGVECHDQVCR